MTSVFISVPVTDLERAKAFYTAVGFKLNPAFTDHNSACFIVEDEHSYLMVMTRDFLQTFTELPLGNPKTHPAGQVSVFLDSREAVDATVAAGVAAGGTEPGEPADYGFMYQRPVNDPDGNHFEFGWMDPTATEGPATMVQSSEHA